MWKTGTGRRYAPSGLLVLLVGASFVPGCDRPGASRPPDVPGPPATAARYPVTVRSPSGPPRIPTGTFDEKGRPVSVACATCHATKPANPDAKLGTRLAHFHQGLSGAHGSLSCVSCHTPTDGYASLRLADGRSVPYAEAVTLCAQCHGPQYRDYRHGAHGGMTGYWDLTKGGRARNTCTDCHDPHAPKYPTVSPAAGPNDRFLTGSGHE